MRLSDEKINSIARETGMIVYGPNGRKSATNVVEGDIELSFEYENPDEEAHVCAYNTLTRKCTYYMGNDLESLREDHPVFFN